MGSFRRCEQHHAVRRGLASLLCPLPICCNLRRHQFSAGALAASSLGWMSTAAEFGRV